MPRKPRILFGLVAAMLTAALVCIAARIPPEALQTEKNGRLYHSGGLYLENHSDTLLLKKFGFREFEFLGRSVRTVHYHAWWPVSAPIDSLPPQLSSIEYDLDTPSLAPDSEETVDDSLPTPSSTPDGNY